MLRAEAVGARLSLGDAAACAERRLPMHSLMATPSGRPALSVEAPVSAPLRTSFHGQRVAASAARALRRRSKGAASRTQVLAVAKDAASVSDSSAGAKSGRGKGFGAGAPTTKAASHIKTEDSHTKTVPDGSSHAVPQNGGLHSSKPAEVSHQVPGTGHQSLGEAVESWHAMPKAVSTKEVQEPVTGSHKPEVGTPATKPAQAQEPVKANQKPEVTTPAAKPAQAQEPVKASQEAEVATPAAKPAQAQEPVKASQNAEVAIPAAKPAQAQEPVKASQKAEVATPAAKPAQAQDAKGVVGKGPEGALKAAVTDKAEKVEKAGVVLDDAAQAASEKEAAQRLLAAQSVADRKAQELAEKRRALEEQKAALEAKRQEEQKELQRKQEEEKKVLDVQRRAKRLPKLQEEHEFIAARMFFYPEVVQAGENVEIFFHRLGSELKDKPGIFIVGGFNDWQWENFQGELKPSSDITNDWWSVTLPTPKEAYLMNFVVHSSDNVYDNNGGEDYYIRVEGGMEEAAFEAMLNKKKREEAEREEAERAERERKAAEEKRIAHLKAQQEAEAAQARHLANEARDRLTHTRSALSANQTGICVNKPDPVLPGKPAQILYNRASRPLGGSQKLFLHAGVNNWEKGVGMVVEMEWDNDQDGNWWRATVDVPEDAVVLNWVIADGPKGAAGVWDNNDRRDFGALVGDDAHVQSLFEELEAKILKRLEAERKEREEEEARIAQKRAAIKAATKARTMEMFLKSQAHVFYTEPAEPSAGKPVKVFYNPNNTILHGRTMVWMKGSYNRWTHRTGCFMPLEMTPAPNGTHFVAEVTPPEDAYVMDLDFLDSFDPVNATYDNRGGLDYHVPLKGATTKAPPLHIIHVALEMAPVAKVGGLGDVVTSLSRAVMEQGHQVEVILPKYDCLKYHHIDNLEERGSFAWGGTNWRCWLGFVEGIPTHFLEPENGIFWVGCVYGRKDDAARFGTFCNAALEFLVQTGRSPDILHCHDWSSAPVAFFHAENYKNWGLGNARSVFTIHNLEFGQALIGKAMAACNMATTVSPTYAQEVSQNAAVKWHLNKFHGIINGIDPDIWDPLVDKFIPMNYTSEEVVEGKRAARQALWERGHLQRQEKPLVGIVTRLTAQKGIHLIKHAIFRTLERGGQAVLLGSAPDPRVQGDFERFADQLRNQHNESARLWLEYDEPLSHLIYAACDIIVVPSMFEPCGLTQLIAMRYGAIPVVRKTGGLNDTVFDVDNDKERAAWLGLEPNGFSFEGTDNDGLDYGLNRAISAWYEGREWWNGLAKRVMEQDWSWNRPSLDYLEVYYGARK